jgi:hypothetical protein
VTACPRMQKTSESDESRRRRLDRANVVIRIGAPYEVLRESRRQATYGFAEDLRRWGLTVEVDAIEYVPGRRGLGPVEWTAIGLAASVGKRLLDNLVDDLYAAARDYLLKRLRKGGTRPKLGFKIYGPDGEELKSWRSDEDDEGRGGRD